MSAEQNIAKYGVSEPPHYDLSQIKDVPIAIMNGTEDLVVSPTDWAWLVHELGDSVCFYKEYELSHYGFLMPANQSHV